MQQEKYQAIGKGKPLQDSQVRSVEQPGRYGDGQGLYLVVSKSKLKGTLRKQWVLRIVTSDKRRDFGLGGYPAVSLAKARRKAEEYRSSVLAGIDPTLKVEEPEPVPVPTFAECARGCHEANAPRWKNRRHTDAWLQTLELYAFPVIGDMPINQIGRREVLRILEPIWAEKAETARRVKQRMRAVFAWAIGKEYIKDQPITESMDAVLPTMPKFKEHMKALEYKEVSAAMDTIADSNASLPVKLCFEFQVLTAARSGEARGATWAEIDLEDRLWKVPADKMKMGVEHRVPLSDAAMDVLARALELRDETELLFPSVNGKMLSDSTISKLMRENGVGAVPHGFRSSFRDWAAENTRASWAAMELSLAHAVGSDVERAYSRSDLLQQRRELMEEWAAFLTGTAPPLRADLPACLAHNEDIHAKCPCHNISLSQFLKQLTDRYGLRAALLGSLGMYLFGVAVGIMGN